MLRIQETKVHSGLQRWRRRRRRRRMCSHLCLNLPIGGVHVLRLQFCLPLLVCTYILFHCRFRRVQVRLPLWLSTMPRRNMEAWRRHSFLPCPLHPGTKSRWFTSSRRLCGFRNLSGRLAEEKHLHLCRESSHGLSVAQSLCRYVYQVQSLQLCWRSFIE